MKTIKTTLLHYQKGTSNKVYNVYLIEVSSSEYLVNFEYGRFGSTLRDGTKTSSPVGLERAQKLFDSLVVSKMNKDYVVKQGYDATKKEEKKERNVLSSDEYKALLVERLSRAGEVESEESTTTRASNGVTGFRALHSSRETVTTVSTSFKTLDNYNVSRLIYKAGTLKLEESKQYILDLYNQDVESSNAFYYAVTWALGRFRDSSLRPSIESLRDKLDDGSKYIVEEALFLLKEDLETRQIKELTFSMPFKTALKNRDLENFRTQVKLLDEMISSTYLRYKNVDSWYEEDKKRVKDELMPLLQSADELYLKLYMYASVDEFMHEALSSVITYLPLTEFNFSLFRRLYKMADMRDDHKVLAQLISKIESKKMACYEIYEWNADNKRSLGCSRQYFKKRSLRHLEHLSTHNEDAYIEFAKNVLLSVNGYEKEFAAFTTEYYDDNWNMKTKKYDAYASHLTFMKILYGAGQRYMLAPSKKVWETANKNIKDEIRPELHKELWDKNVETVVEILANSKVLLVQTFAFNILKDNPEALKNIALEMLLQMMNLAHDEARKLFFEVLKEQYAKTEDTRIIKACLFSEDEEINAFAIEKISTNLDFLLEENIMVEIIEKCNVACMDQIFTLVPKLENKRVIVDDIVSKILRDTFPFKPVEVQRMYKLLRYSTEVINVEDITKLMAEDELNERHLFAVRIIRLKALVHLELPLALKEKIAKYEHPEMLATTIYLLGQLEPSELMAAHEMLVTFLYHEEKAVHKEARAIIEKLAMDKESGKVLLRAIVEKSFVSASDEVAKNVTMTVKSMKRSYGAIEPDQLYRMLIAKSKLAVALGSLILAAYKATDFSVVQWARMAKNPNKKVRVWAYDAYMDNVKLVKEAMPKSLMIFDSAWEDTRVFASGYFENFEMSTDDIVVVADSNYADVQAFAKKMIGLGDYDTEVLLSKLSQHPALTIQKFVTDLMLGEMSDDQLLKMERFFNTLLHSVNQNRVAKTRTMQLLKKRLENPEIAEMVGRLASHHSATMVWSDKELYVEMMAYIAEKYPEIALPLKMLEVEKREVV
ncbi:MAG: Unknown protein [uncultured Sulfurovum sp.]|uniref:WGR domain-containing protein n=1 Tax=uncultured Sulfurovum sp. TaxID=269237 RepID=A0A6S6TJ08_9BACT|nr:MAG: Unknown protein [uncultured Sulfurovum sp.]